MSEGRASIPADVLDHINSWGRLWGISNFGSDVRVVFSKRLRVTLARCRPAEGRIVLREDLRHRAPARLAEVLCHEAAHIATHKLYGRSVKPHGAEWKKLVRLAGYKPLVRMRASAQRPAMAVRAGARRIYEHRCPVCQVMRLGRKAVPTWRCADCLEARLNGVLIITCHEAPTRHRRAR